MLKLPGWRLIRSGALRRLPVKRLRQNDNLAKNEKSDKLSITRREIAITMTEFELDGEPNALRTDKRAVPFCGLQRLEAPVGIYSYADAEAQVNELTLAEATREQGIDAVRMQIRASHARLLELRARHQRLGAAVKRAEANPVSLWYEAAHCRWAQQHCSTLIRSIRRQLRRLREIERGLAEDLRLLARAREENEAGSATSPAMGVWQFLVDRTSHDTLNTHTQLALAQELIDAGLVEDPAIDLASDLSSYLATSIATRAARDFFFEEFAVFVRAHLAALSKKAADIRTLAFRWVLKLTTETGSAAAIAKRMNPLGAPPQLA